MLEWTALLETKASPIPALLKLVLAPVLFSTVLLISTSDQWFVFPHDAPVASFERLDTTWFIAWCSSVACRGPCHYDRGQCPALLRRYAELMFRRRCGLRVFLCVGVFGRLCVGVLVCWVVVV